MENSNWYEIKIPDEWERINNEGVTSIHKKKNGVGAIQISVFSIPSNYQLDLFDELFDFTSGFIKNEKSYKLYNKICKIKDGLILPDISENNRKWIFAIYSKESKIVLVTYNSLIDNFDIEGNEARIIIDSIRL